jgi:hypothetical protein
MHCNPLKRQVIIRLKKDDEYHQKVNIDQHV